jgi:hypothetical protein
MKTLKEQIIELKELLGLYRGGDSKYRPDRQRKLFELIDEMEVPE